MVTYCTVCNAVTNTAHTDVDATGHTPGAAATCTTNQTCTVCSVELAPATGHTPGAAATCNAAQTCTVCSVELAPATNHTEGTPVTENDVPATCTVDGGYDTVVYCSACNTELSRVHTNVTATGHSYTESVTAPTCKAGGYTTYTCACGDTYKANEVPALEHTVVIDNAVAPTCSKTGKTEGSHCSVCDTVIIPQNNVPTIPHKEITVAGKDATCTATGLTEGKKCSVCGTVTKAQQEIAQLEHDYEVETDPEKIMLYTYCSVCGEKGKFAKSQFTEQLKKITVVAACALVIILCVCALCKPATTTPWWKRRR